MINLTDNDMNKFIAVLSDNLQRHIDTFKLYGKYILYLEKRIIKLEEKKK